MTSSKNIKKRIRIDPNDLQLLLYQIEQVMDIIWLFYFELRIDFESPLAGEDEAAFHRRIARETVQKLTGGLEL